MVFVELMPRQGLVQEIEAIVNSNFQFQVQMIHLVKVFLEQTTNIIKFSHKFKI